MDLTVFSFWEWSGLIISFILAIIFINPLLFTLDYHRDVRLGKPSFDLNFLIIVYFTLVMLCAIIIFFVPIIILTNIFNF